MIFEKFVQRIQFRFRDRIVAAIALSEILKDIIKKEDRKKTLVLGIPRAGVITADIVARKLSITNFDIFITKKLTDPDNKEQAIGAVAENGFINILHHLVQDFQISEEYLKKEIITQRKEIMQRELKFRLDRPNVFGSGRIREFETILLVDDGIASGATMMVAVKSILQINKNIGIKQSSLKRLIVAAPVAPREIISQIRREFNVEVVFVFNPSQNAFHSVEQYHLDFNEVSEEQVVKIMNERTRF